MDNENVSDGARDIAKRLISASTRRDLGKFYLLWSVYAPAIALINILMGHFSPYHLPPISYVIVDTLFSFGLLYLTRFTFVRTKERYLRFAYPDYRPSARKRLLNTVLLLLFFVVIIVVIDISTLMRNQTGTVLYFVAYYLFIYAVYVKVFSKVFSRTRLTNPRWYDRMAFLTLLILPFLQVFLPVFADPFTVIWFSAGILSLRGDPT